MSGKIKIVLADDHKVVRQGIAALLLSEPGFEIAAQAENGEQALKLVEDVRPDVLVLDIGLPDMDGISLTSSLKTTHPEVPVLILSMQDNAHTVKAALRAGARGYVLKGEGISDLCKAIRAAHQGETYLSAEVAHLVQPGRAACDPTQIDPLSPRELEVLALVAEGFTARQIADKLGLSPKTVENHRANIMDRLGIRTIAGLVRYAMRIGLTR
jgi:two-component system response regulator NreC